MYIKLKWVRKYSRIKDIQKATDTGRQTNDIVNIFQQIDETFMKKKKKAVQKKKQKNTAMGFQFEK